MTEQPKGRTARPVRQASATTAGTRQRATKKKKKTSGAAAAAKRARISRTQRPAGMTIEDWQVALRRQFGREQDFRMKNVGEHPLFSDFEVHNPQSGRTYRVAVRGAALGDNYCSCPDFAVNTLGTCKHIEFVLARLGRTKKAARELGLGYQPPYSEIFLRYGAQRQIVCRPGSECPPAVRAALDRAFDASGVLRPEAAEEIPNLLARAEKRGHALRCYDDVYAYLARLRDRAHREEALARLFPRGVRSGSFAGLLKVPLYRYQREGALFAARTGRCLIADEMGLGKTVQAIAGAEILAKIAGVERVLVVCPTSLKHQWRQELAKFAGRDALVVEGFAHRRAAAYGAEAFYKITNYDVIRRDLDHIAHWQPDLVILDEAQRIKNWQTVTAQSVKRLESDYAIVLTGTPLENRLEELYSIVEVVDRFRLGPMFRFLAEHQQTDENGKVVGYRNLHAVSQTLAPLLIRRTKDEVLTELPERLEKRFFVPMTPAQMQFHEEAREVVARIVAKWRNYGFLSETDQQRLRAALQRMRMACNSTYLVDQETDHGHKADELVNHLEEIFEDPAAKVVVFSQWVRMHEIIVPRLKRRKWDHILFHGGVAGPKRKDLVQRFREDDRCRLFLSTDAGGLGLNLQHASAVMILDQPWNPALLEQRIGRVHRLGQQRPVRVVHFIARGTIEEGMLAVLAFKKSVFAGVLDGGENEVFLGGTKLKRFIDSVEKVTAAVPDASGPGLIEDAAGSLDREAAGDGRRRGDGEAAGRRGEAAALFDDPAWDEVFEAGKALVDKLGKALGVQIPTTIDVTARAPGEAEGGEAAGVARLLEGLPLDRLPPPESFLSHDEATGRPCLKLPMPEPSTVQGVLQLLGGLLRQ